MPATSTPRLPRYGRLTHEQERLGVTGSVQLRPRDGTTLSLDMLYAKLDATRQEDFLEAISFSRSAAQGGKPQTSVVSASYDANGALQQGTFNGVDIRAESRFDKLTTTFTQPTLTLEQEISETLKLNAKVGRADSKFRNPFQTTTTLDALNVNGYSIDFRGNDRLPVITYPFDVTQPGGRLALVTVPQVASGTQPATIANTTSSEIRIRPQGTDNRTDLANFNLEWDALPGQVTIKGGADYKKFGFSTYEFRRVNQNDTIFAPPAGTSVASLTTMLTGFGKGLSLPAGTPTSWAIPNLQAIVEAYDIYCNCLKSGPAGGPGDFTLSSTTNGNARGNNRAVTETDTGGFLMADFNTRLAGYKLRGNAGVRYVQTKQSATGYLATGGGTPVTVEQNYSDVLPAINLATDLSKDLVWRVAAAKVMSRPQLGNLNPGGTISTTGTLSITTGNPLLKPFRAKTFDTSLEWYHQRNGFVGLGLFQKNISTYIQSLRQNVAFKDTGLPLSLLPANFTGDEVFQATIPVNTDGGKLQGFEINVQQPFSFLPGAGKNLGVLLNYTQVKSKIAYQVSPTSATTITDDLLNLSPKSWNATLYYDDGKFSARVSGSSRSAFLTRVPGQNNNDVEGKNSSLNVDLSISYKLNDQIEFTFEGLNLTNEANDQFISRARNSSVVYHVTGREYLLGHAVQVLSAPGRRSVAPVPAGIKLAEPHLLRTSHEQRACRHAGAAGRQRRGRPAGGAAGGRLDDGAADRLRRRLVRTPGAGGGLPQPRPRRAQHAELSCRGPVAARHRAAAGGRARRAATRADPVRPQRPARQARTLDRPGQRVPGEPEALRRRGARRRRAAGAGDATDPAQLPWRHPEQRPAALGRRHAGRGP